MLLKTVLTFTAFAASLSALCPWLESASPYTPEGPDQGRNYAKAGAEAVQVNVVTYNILSKVHDYHRPAWASRKSAIGIMIHSADVSPDILAMQEGIELSQVYDLDKEMGPGYDQYISSKTISPRAIFWKNDQYRLMSASDELIITKPDSSAKFRHQCYATCVRLKHTATGKMLMVFNVHLPLDSREHTYQKVRNETMDYLAARVKKYSADYGNMPVIVMGDFNNYKETVIQQILSAPATLAANGMSDTYEACPAANLTNPGYRTKNDILKSQGIPVAINGTKRLDYIFTYPQANVSVLDWKNVLHFTNPPDLDSPVPSDHNPISSRLILRWHK